MFNNNSDQESDSLWLKERWFRIVCKDQLAALNDSLQAVMVKQYKRDVVLRDKDIPNSSESEVPSNSESEVPSSSENIAFKFKDKDGMQQIYLFRNTNKQKNSVVKKKVKSEFTLIMKQLANASGNKDKDEEGQADLFCNTDKENHRDLKGEINLKIKLIVEQIINAAYNCYVNSTKLDLFGIDKKYHKLAKKFYEDIQKKLNYLDFSGQNILPTTIEENNEKLKEELNNEPDKALNEESNKQNNRSTIRETAELPATINFPKNDPKPLKNKIKLDKLNSVYTAKGIGGRSIQEAYCEIVKVSLYRIHDAAKFLYQLYMALGMKMLKHSSHGTTHATVYVTHRDIYVANIGDSSVFLVTQEKIQQLNIHHNTKNNKEKIRVEEEGSKLCGIDGLLKLDGELAVTRSYGDRKYPGVSFTPTITSTKKPTTDGTYVVLCNRGITDYLSASEIQNIISKVSTGKNIAEKVREAAYNAAKEKAKTLYDVDNMVVVVAPVNTIGLYAVFDGHHSPSAHPEPNVAELCKKSLAETVKEVITNQDATITPNAKVVKSVSLTDAGPEIEFWPVAYEQVEEEKQVEEYQQLEENKQVEKDEKVEENTSENNPQLLSDQPAEVDDDNDSEPESETEDDDILSDWNDQGSSTGHHGSASQPDSDRRNNFFGLNFQARSTEDEPADVLELEETNPEPTKVNLAITSLIENWFGVDNHPGYGNTKWYDVVRPYIFCEIDKALILYKHIMVDQENPEASPECSQQVATNQFQADFQHPLDSFFKISTKNMMLNIKIQISFSPDSTPK